MNRSRSEDFNPARLLTDATPLALAEGAADVAFETRLGEGEVGGSQAHFDVVPVEEFAEE